MKQQISSVCRACYFHIRQISRIRKFLSQESVVKPVSCFVLSCLDYCNSLLSGLPIESINQQASKCSKLCRSAHFRHEETQTHHSYSEKSPLAACLSVNPLQAVSFPLQQELRHSSSFIIIYLWPSQFIHCLSHTTPCRWYNQTASPTLSAQAVWQTCIFQICTFCVELSACWSPWNLHHRLFQNLSQNSPFALLLDLVPGLNESNLELDVHVCKHTPLGMCVCVCACLCICVHVCACVCVRMYAWVCDVL